MHRTASRKMMKADAAATVMMDCKVAEPEPAAHDSGGLAVCEAGPGSLVWAKN